MKKIISISLLSCFAAFSFATQRIVTESTDNYNSPTEGMLRYWLSHASSGDTILFSVATVNLDTTLRMSGGKSLTIDGGENGVVLDVNNNGRVFNVSCYSGDNLYLRNLTIKNGSLNSTLAMGGGMYAYISLGNLQVENCTFINNSVISDSDGQGGAIRTNGGTFKNCFFLNNSVSGSTTVLGGGAIFALDATFINCVVAGNYAAYGGGIYASASVFYNCTITQNESSNADEGGGVNCEDNCLFINSILYNNRIDGVENNIFNYQGSSTFRYCAVENGNALVGINSNIGLSETPFTHTGNDSLNLNAASVCVDAGTSISYTLLPTDIAGNNRILGSKVDIGAYEYKIPTFSSIVVTNNSSNISIPYSLPWAVSHIEKGGTITFDNDYHITLTEEIPISKGMTIDGSGHFIELDGNNNKRIFNINASVQDTVTLKNLVILKGYYYSYGGGVYVNSNLIKIINCVFEDNSASQGGALYCNGKAAIYNSTFIKNKTTYVAGAAYVVDSSTFINCLFYDNQRTDFFSFDGNCSFLNCAADVVLPGSNNIKLWKNPLLGGTGSDRFSLLPGSFCSNAGTKDTTGMFLPALDINSNTRIQVDTIDIGACESSYTKTPTTELFDSIVVTNAYFDVDSAFCLPWALKHIADKGYIRFADDFIIPFTRTLFLGDRNLTIDGSGSSIEFNGGDSVNFFAISGINTKKITIEGITFKNGNSLFGGAIYANLKLGGYLTIKSCFFTQNKADQGGGVYLLPPWPNDNIFVMKNSVFDNNSAISAGGGLYSNINTSGGTPLGNLILNCTFTNNSAGYLGGGVYNEGNSRFYNCLFYNNETPSSSRDWMVNGAKFFYCATQESYLSSTNIILYSNPFMPNSLTLNSDSYCVNAGTPDTTGLGLPEFDIEGNRRILNDTIDIGAFESIYKNKKTDILLDNVIVNNSSFDPLIENSILWAIHYVKDGGTISFSKDLTIDVTSQIALGQKSVSIDGEKNRIIFDGGDSTRIFIVNGFNYDMISEISLRNLTIQNGYANDGGGIYNSVFSSSRLNIENCLLYSNYAYYGGGIYYEGFGTLNNNVFINNKGISGAGLYVYDNYNSKHINNCSFYANTSNNGSGAGIRANGGIFTNCLIYGNSAPSNSDAEFSASTVFNYCASGRDLSSQGTGNIVLTENPFDGTTLYDSLKLKTGSLLIDAGNPDTNGLKLIKSDFLGNTRIVGDAIDIGAYEYYNHSIFASVNNPLYGKILPGTIQVLDGSTHRLKIEPNPGFLLDSIKIDHIQTDSAEYYSFINIAGDHSIEVFFHPDTFDVQIVTGVNGVASHESVIVTYLDTVNIIIKPDTGYSIGSIEFNGIDVSSNLIRKDTSMVYPIMKSTKDAILNISFKPDIFRISTRLNNYNIGNITPWVAFLSYWDSITFSITTMKGYSIESALLGDSNILADLSLNGNECTFKVKKQLSDKLLDIKFKVDSFDITVISDTNGVITPDFVRVSYFNPYEFFVLPDSGYVPYSFEIGDMKYIDHAYTDSGYFQVLTRNDSLWFRASNILKSNRVKINFGKAKLNIKVNVSGNGTVTPGDTLVDFGNSLMFNIYPETGYYIASAYCGEQNILELLSQVESHYTYRIQSITSDTTFSITFAKYNGIKDFSLLKTELDIYPNPASDRISLRLNSDFSANEVILKLYNVTGELVYLKNYGEFKSAIIDVSKLEQGEYLLSINSTDNIILVSRKIVIQH
ncbi:MAG: T9SS type A sorting domain-containing protein [Bacteroidales bacterium]|nr:T9SS type A sorting domain-containing protein [Bacteroidales bacterium]